MGFGWLTEGVAELLSTDCTIQQDEGRSSLPAILIATSLQVRTRSTGLSETRRSVLILA